MSLITKISKLPGELLTQKIEFSDAMRVGESISSVATDAREKESRRTATVVTSSNVTGTIMDVVISISPAAERGVIYEIDCLATLNLGDVLGHRLEITIQ